MTRRDWPPGPAPRPLRFGRWQGERLLAALLVGSVLLCGCRAGGKNFDNENDTLRRQVSQLESEVSRLAAERNEALAQRELAIARLAAATGEPAAAVVRAMPTAAGVSIARLSGPVAEARPGQVDAVEVFVRPFDGRRRFVQVAGTLTVEAVLLGDPGLAAGSDATGAPVMPVRLGVVTLGPDEVREAYRSSPLGTHYAVRIPVRPAVPVAGASRVAITVVLEDAITGQRHVATEIVTRVHARSSIDDAVSGEGSGAVSGAAAGRAMSPSGR